MNRSPLRFLVPSICTGILLAVFGLAPPVAFPLPVVDVVGGFDGFYRPGAWTPVVVTINNQPTEDKGTTLEDFQAVLTIPTESISDPPQKYSFTREITVPAYSIQRFYLYAKFPESPVSPVVEMRTPNGRLLDTYPLNIQPLYPGNVLLVLVSEELEPVRLPSLAGADPILRSNSPPERLPEHWWGYESVGALILTRWSETYLRPPQEQALEQWLQAGGTLVILAGSDPSAWKGGLMDRLLPGTAGASERIRILPAEEGGGASRIQDPSQPIAPNDLVVARLQPNLDAEVLAEVEGLPLLVRSKYGRGTVLFFAMDFQDSPESVSQVFSPYWRALVPYDPLTDSRNSWRADIRSKTQVVSRRAARPPNVFLIFLLLVGYVIAVGPLNFRFLSKRKKVEWAWFTVPAIVLLFSGLIYGIGVLTKGGRLIVREASLVRGTEGDGLAVLDGMVGLFSPEKQRYAARPDNPDLALGESDQWSDSLRNLRQSFSAFGPVQIGRQPAGGLLGFGDARTVVRLEDDGQVVAQRPLGQWDLAFLETYGLVDLDGDIESQLTWRENQVFGTIKNGTARTLRNPILYHSGFGLKLPRDLLPGDSFTLAEDSDLLPAAGSPGTAGSRWIPFAEALSSQLLESTRFPSEDEYLAAQTRNYLAHYEFQPDLTDHLFPPHGGETWLIAFSNEPVADITLSAQPDVLTHSVCYAFRLPARPESGPRTVNPNRVAYELLLQSLEGEVFFVDEGYLELKGSTVVVSAKLPFEIPEASVDRVGVSLALQPGASQEVAVEILNLRTLRWEPVPIREEQENPKLYQLSVGGDAGRYATPLTGRVFLRLTSKDVESTIFAGGHFATVIVDLSVSYLATVP